MITANFFDIKRLLELSGASISPSEAHGIVAGVLCHGEPQIEDSWLDDITFDEGDNNRDVSECRQSLLGLYRETDEALFDGDFDFQPMLPDDRQPLNIRSDALSSWCSGFLYGLSLAGAHVFEQLQDECREVVQDLADFARLSANQDETEKEELAFMELVEYLRVGVLMIAHERRQQDKVPPGMQIH